MVPLELQIQVVALVLMVMELQQVVLAVLAL
jgi:hypothetical protein